MKTLALIARILLGLIFLVFGLNGFLHFIHMPPPPGLAGAFGNILAESRYSVVVFGVQLICAILLLVNQYVPLALAMLAAVIVNILTFHTTMQPAGLPLALLVTILWLIVASQYKSAFMPLLTRNPSNEVHH